MAVGTQGTVKGILPETLRQVGVNVLLGNTYHLTLRPGEQTVRELGGLHAFMGWQGPILTDSGGYQMFSLADRCKVTDDGVTFQSHIDGSALEMTPESAMQIQQTLGADMIMCFDQCVRNPAPLREAQEAVTRTIAWAARCRAAHQDGSQMLLGIVQGALDETLRRECAAALREIGFGAYAIGGLSVGESKPETYALLGLTDELLPADRPRYLMGVGPPEDLLAAIECGVDMFDCVLPTRNGRTGQAFTPDGPINLKNAVHREDPAPLERGCDCPACTGYTRGALRHFVQAREMLGPILISIHNLCFFQRLMAAARAAILAGRFQDFKREFLDRYQR